jgi:cobalt-zinc-cadmium efflux system protein
VYHRGRVPHSHDHAPAPRAAASRAQQRRLRLALLLAVAYMGAEVAGGLWTGSLALLADAGHMLSDSAALALSLFALWVAQRPPTPQRSYGYYRAEILAALAQGALLVAVAVGIALEAFERLGSAPEVRAAPMFAIAAGGLVVNLISLLILRAGAASSLNVRGAFLHVLSDALGSVSAMLAAALLFAFGWRWADPAASLAISVLIVVSAWHLLAEATGVLLEGSPRHIDVEAVRDAIRGVPGVEAVHDLHVWSIASGLVALSCHVVAAGGRDAGALIGEVNRALSSRFGIDHTTIQVEPEGFEETGVCV